MRVRAPRGRVLTGALAGALTGVALAGCSVSGAGEEQTLTVLAAASLTDTFTTLEREFEATHEDVDVTIAFDSSATLATQVRAGAPADVLATADMRTMRTVVDAGLTDGEPAVFATNEMVLAVPADNPADIEELADLDQPGVSYVACVESAPCGAVARELLERNDIGAEPSSLEVDVKAALTKVELDEADAGLVYATDTAAAGDAVRTVEIPGAGASRNTYPVAVAADSAQPRLAREWVDLLLSETGQDVLADAGFGAPR